MPFAAPEIFPKASVVAILVAPLAQVPPLVVFANDMVAPTQTESKPVIVPASGKGFIVNVCDAEVLDKLDDEHVVVHQ